MIKVNFGEGTIERTEPSEFAIWHGQQIALSVRLARKRFLASSAAIQAEQRWQARKTVQEIMFA